MELFRKKEKTVDLTGKYDRHKEKMENIKELVNKAESVAKSPQANSQSSLLQQNKFGFLGNLASASSPQASSDYEENSEDRKRKLAKRLMDITEKLEDLSTQIYHLQQRIELLEKKAHLNID